MVNYFNIASSSSILYGMCFLTSKWLGGGSSVDSRVIPWCGRILPEVVEMGSICLGHCVPFLAVLEEGCGAGPYAAALSRWQPVAPAGSAGWMHLVAWLLRPG